MVINTEKLKYFLATWANDDDEPMIKNVFDIIELVEGMIEDFRKDPDSKHFYYFITELTIDSMMKNINVAASSSPDKIHLQMKNSLEGGQFSREDFENAINKAVEKFYNDNF